jgi:hypothetical protein
LFLCDDIIVLYKEKPKQKPSPQENPKQGRWEENVET